jgi:hypothetical protein
MMVFIVYRIESVNIQNQESIIGILPEKDEIAVLDLLQVPGSYSFFKASSPSLDILQQFTGVEMQVKKDMGRGNASPTMKNSCLKRLKIQMYRS